VRLFFSESDRTSRDLSNEPSLAQVCSPWKEEGSSFNMSVMQQLLARGAKQSWSGLSQTLCGRGATPATVASGLQSRTFAAAPSPKKAETEAYVRPSSDKEVPRDIAGSKSRDESPSFSLFPFPFPPFRFRFRVVFASFLTCPFVSRATQFLTPVLRPCSSRSS